ncbi:MAG: bifunctional alpha,alpha-trehalose-phosphate synthase (UDP-forming)/trehalose-phosphatase [Nitrospirae bacterium]|nr:bifunctional alpha,alpha-trehalose-phosphate synthase (UDP-forming)/trehalose-phosphatase [Nitrospirota bacterium]
MNMLNNIIEENFPDKTLVIVSNREPYIHKKRGDTVRVETPAGGLTSAMDDILKATGGTWVALGTGNYDREVVDEKDCIMVPPDNPSYKLKRVWLEHHVIENYYHGYSNQVLWPLTHITLDRIHFRECFWKDYRIANQAFADAVLEEVDEGGVVWIHDYHLCLLPAILKQKRGDLTLAHFWHIPWPNWGVYRVCPQAQDILEGLLCNDLIGFQIPLFVKNFMDCVRECLKADVDYDNASVTYRGHTTRLKAFPISIDYDKFNSMATAQKAIRLIKKFKSVHGIEKMLIGIGVDRLEYTKALLKRFQAIEHFFETYERFREKFTFIQIAVPTRMSEPYISYKKSVEESISWINKKYSKGKWKPIIYIDNKVDHKELAALYRMSDVAIISSVYDGMNLVAKEYVASQVDEKGMLILSEFAGAAEELEGALLVNPYDIEDFSERIKTILDMSLEEKMTRMNSMRRHVKTHDIYQWISDFLKETAEISLSRDEKFHYIFDYADELKARMAGKNIFVFIDYDGTLTPIVESPDKARLSDDIPPLLSRLRMTVPVAIVSGRKLEDLKRRVGVEGIIYAGNHGAEIFDGSRTVVNQESSADPDLLKDFLERLGSALSHLEGVVIENKGITASIHFRLVNPKYLWELLSIFRKTAKNYEGAFRITHGKKVIEIRPGNTWNKGNAVSWIMENMGQEGIPLYIGDDTTDEDAYRAIKDKGISISIGKNTEAEYYLKTQGEVKGFIRWFLEQ